MSTQQYSAEASFQARGNTMNGCELIVTEVATGTSGVSHQDAFKNAQSAAQEAAQKKLKEELMKINTGSSCQMVVCGPIGPIGPDGRRGRTGPSGTPGQDGALANFIRPIGFLNGPAILLPVADLDDDQLVLLKFIIDLSSNNSTRAPTPGKDAIKVQIIDKIAKAFVFNFFPLLTQKSSNANIFFIKDKLNPHYGATNYGGLNKSEIAVVFDILIRIIEYEVDNSDLPTLFTDFIRLEQNDKGDLYTLCLLKGG